jgi:hypothetical protein
MCEAKPWVSFDCLISSSKLQPGLELCQFVQALIKTKVVRWKVHLLLRSCEKTLVQHSSERESRILHLESRSYHKSYSSPKAYCFLRIVDKKHSLVVLSHCLTPLNSACLSFTLNQVHSLVHIYHRAIPWFTPWCSCIAYFEWVPYMASVHSQAMWSWSQPSAHISILS